MADKAKAFGKRVIGYPEEPIPVVSSKDWANDTFTNPRSFVSFVYGICTIYVDPGLPVGTRLPTSAVPNNWMDWSVQ